MSGKHECNYCYKTFSRKSDLNKHEKDIHIGNIKKSFTEFVCPVCSEIYEEKSMLSTHYMVHHRN